MTGLLTEEKALEIGQKLIRDPDNFNAAVNGIARALIEAQIAMGERDAKAVCIGCKANRPCLNLNEGIDYHVDGYGLCSAQDIQRSIASLRAVQEKLKG